MTSYFKKRRLIKQYNHCRPAHARPYFCIAPATALRFHRNGSVQVCCHHIDYLKLGERSLEDIWFGPELKQMRSQMRDYSIPEACNFCSACYYNGDFSNVNARSFDQWTPDPEGYPVFMDFSIDNRCNLACIMCDASLSSEVQRERGFVRPEPDFVYGDKFMADIEPFIPRLKGAIFTGGEPFLIKAYYPLWDSMLRLNPRISIGITTNATVYNDQIRGLLDRGRFQITASVDSFRKETYELIRKGACFESVLENVNNFAAQCKTNDSYFGVTICPMKINWAEVPDIVQRCNENNWHFTYNIVLKPWQHALWSMCSSELEEVIRFYEDAKLTGEQNECSPGNDFRFSTLTNLLRNWHRRALEYERDVKSLVMMVKKRERFQEFIVDILQTDKTTSQEITVDKVKQVIEMVPDRILHAGFINMLNHISAEMVNREFRENDVHTIAEHFTILGFNAGGK